MCGLSNKVRHVKYKASFLDSKRFLPDAQTFLRTEVEHSEGCPVSELSYRLRGAGEPQSGELPDFSIIV